MRAKIIHKKGIGFGLSSGIITTLGLMVGLFGGTQSRLAVLTGIVSIAIIDAFSDSLSLHIAEESQAKTSHKKIWFMTFQAFFAKFIFAIIFIAPVLILPLRTAIIFNLILGTIILVIYNYKISKKLARSPISVILEHLSITIAVLIITYLLGTFLHDLQS